MVLYLFVIIGLFLVSYFIAFVRETIMIKRNSRPKMTDNSKIRFKDLIKIKTQKYGEVESR